MKGNVDIIECVKSSATKRLLFLPHTIRQMSRPDRLITAPEIRSVIFHGNVIEDYPEDARGHSCLMIGFGDDGRAIHVVCSPKDEYLARV